MKNISKGKCWPTILNVGCCTLPVWIQDPFSVCSLAGSHVGTSSCSICESVPWNKRTDCPSGFTSVHTNIVCFKNKSALSFGAKWYAPKKSEGVLLKEVIRYLFDSIVRSLFFFFPQDIAHLHSVSPKGTFVANYFHAPVTQVWRRECSLMAL